MELNMPEKNYRIRLIRAGNEFEVEGDKEFVLEMIEKFEIFSKTLVNISDPLSVQTSSSAQITVDSNKPTSLGEFIRQLGFKKHTDKVLAFGYYLEIFSGQTEFTPADINTCYYEAKMDSSNTSQMIIQNIRRGVFMQSKNGDKKYMLTQTGIDFIQNKLNQSNQE
jgi:predicted transcriptional regulator